METIQERRQADNGSEKGQRGLLKYVLVTPARNEAAFIQLTIKSVIAQDPKPLRWVIVSDGSTDGTDEIVSRYVAEHDWIELVRMPERNGRNFAAKVLAFNSGYERVKGIDFDLIGSLDGDISFESGFFSFLLEKFNQNPRLGVAGGRFLEAGKGYDFRFSSTEHVSGACQLFRRECFEGIGGYLPVKGGGIDVIAVLSARMKGWQARTYPERSYLHHRSMGSAQYGKLTSKFMDGQKDYVLGGHPTWEILRAAYQLGRSPWLLGGCALLAGYLLAAALRLERSMPSELVRFRRQWQMERLKQLVRKPFGVPQRLTNHKPD